MKKILLTGGTGFIGRNVLPILNKKYEILAPSRDKLNLKSKTDIYRYLKNNDIDTVLHFANPNPAKNPLDKIENMIDDSLRIFMNFYENRNILDKLIFLGSGAQYDKTMDISNISENECFRSIPHDAYGFSKYIMTHLAVQSENVYNICPFGVYGPSDADSKFITHCIRCCLRNETITIRQDCRFDYIHVYDLASIAEWMIENKPKHHMYNAGSGNHLFLSEIAGKVNTQFGNKQEIKLLKSGFNKEYTSDNYRFTSESGVYPKISIDKGITMQIEYEMEHYT